MSTMSVKEAAKYLGVSMPTVWRLIIRRDLGHVKVGRRTVLLQQELDRYLMKHVVPAKDEARSSSRKSA